MEVVTKGPSQVECCRRPYLRTVNARGGIAWFLESTRAKTGRNPRVLLPSYIGWSANEGSGVLDPVLAAGAEVRFFRLDRSLHIDLDDLEERVRTFCPTVVVFIHYFGHVDPHIEKAIAVARNAGAYVMEDEAHAMLTDLIGGQAGRFGDAAVLSLHKILPFATGGLLLINNPEFRFHSGGAPEPGEAVDLWAYDLNAIGRRRIKNALLLRELIASRALPVDLLWDFPRAGEVPQTLPILVHTISRDQLYFALNRRGFGVVSLYHTLVDAIRANDYPDSHFVSRHILNLPVHQDINETSLSELVDALDEELRRTDAEDEGSR